jgi:hypothetical protein
VNAHLKDVIDAPTRVPGIQEARQAATVMAAGPAALRLRLRLLQTVVARACCAGARRLPLPGETSIHAWNAGAFTWQCSDLASP